MWKYAERRQIRQAILTFVASGRWGSGDLKKKDDSSVLNVLK